MFITKVHHNEIVAVLEREVAHYRKLYEEERLRADRLQDTLLQTMALPPISNEGMARQEQIAKSRLDIGATLSELYAEDIGKMELTEDEMKAVAALSGDEVGA